MTLPAGTEIGKYIVRKKLAEGGMAEIYLAASQGAEGFQKEVVIKRIRSFMASDPGFVDMFIAEAQLASHLNHANVVQIFDFAKHEDTYYLAMEYVRGCALSDLRKKCTDLLESMPPVLVAHIGAEVARGLHYAHRLKVNGEPLFLVHRDVTPHNVLISFDGAVKLTDFGIAKAGNKLTSPGMLKGKFAYMSPEQSRGENVDARTDVFALGIVLWEMLTGSRLFQGDSDLAVLRAVQQSQIPSPSRVNPEVPEELSAVVMKALERDPEARYQTAGELERALIQCVLNHAQSPDDTDVASFVRRVYIGMLPSAQALPAVPERTQQSKGGARKAGNEPVPPGSTAVHTGPRGRSRSSGGGGQGPEASPDEDVHASTHMLPPRVNTPGKPMPAVSGGEASYRSAEQGSAPVRQSQRIPAVSSSADAASESPRYDRTVSLSGKAVSEPTEEPAPSKPASPRRMGLWAGIGVVGLLAAVGVHSLLRPAPPASQPVNPDTRIEPAATSPSGPSAPPPAANPQPTEPAPAANPGAVAATPPANPPPAQTPDPAPAQTQPQTPAVAETAPPKPASVKGSLIVRATPYATVLVNGRSYGDVQGQKTIKLDPGSYKLEFQHPKGSKTERFTLEPNGTVKLEFRAGR